MIPPTSNGPPDPSCADTLRTVNAPSARAASSRHPQTTEAVWGCLLVPPCLRTLNCLTVLRLLPAPNSEAEQTNDQQRGVHQEPQHAPRDQIGQQCEKDQPSHQAATLASGCTWSARNEMPLRSPIDHGDATSFVTLTGVISSRPFVSPANLTSWISGPSGEMARRDREEQPSLIVDPLSASLSVEHRGRSSGCHVPSGSGVNVQPHDAFSLSTTERPPSLGESHFRGPRVPPQAEVFEKRDLRTLTDAGGISIARPRAEVRQPAPT